MDLKEERKKLGLSQVGMAVKIGVSINTYINWERGGTKPNPENLDKLNKIVCKSK